MNEKTPKSFDELVSCMLPYFPDCEVTEDLSGQLIVNTGLGADYDSRIYSLSEAGEIPKAAMPPTMEQEARTLAEQREFEDASALIEETLELQQDLDQTDLTLLRDMAKRLARSSK